MRILIADDHELIRRGVRALLGGRPDFHVCGEAVDGQNAVEQARHLRPDLIVMDITMPRMNGLEATREIRRAFPETEVLVLSQHDSPEMMRQALRAGARGYVVKSAISADLVAGIESIRKGELFFSDDGGKAPKAQKEKEPQRTGFAGSVESLLAAIVDSSDDAIISKDLNGIITSWNKSAERLFGYSAAEAIGQPIMIIIPPDRRAEEAQIIERIKRGERIDHYETVRKCRDGQMVDLSVSISPVHDATGRIVGASNVGRDITERKRKDFALSQTESQLAAEAIALAKLNDWSSRLWRTERLEDGLQQMLGAIIELLGADKGIVRMLAPEGDKLQIAAHHGFEMSSLKPFQDVSVGGNTASGRAVRTGKPVVVEDIETDEEYAEFRAAARAAELRAVVAAPMTGASGWPLGVLAAHFPAPHKPSEQEMRRLDLYVRQAADFIQRYRTEETLRRSEDRLRGLSESLDAEVRARTRELETRNAEVVRQSEQLRALSWQLLRTEDEERRRIARELHDSAGQTLTMMGMTTSRIADAARGAPEVAEAVEEMLELIKQLSKEIRTMSYLLHPPLLDESGLRPALSWYVRGAAERSGLDISLEIDEDFGRLSRDLELMIFRVVQESLTNILRHSESSRALIKLMREGQKVTLEVRDHGKGISPARMAELESSAAGMGIRGMRERLRQFRGEMAIESDGSGTVVRVAIPVLLASAQAGSAG